MTLLEASIAKLRSDIGNKEEMLCIWLKHGHMNPEQVISIAESLPRMKAALELLKTYETTNET